jgi:carboxymethylenebutenolidase
MHTESLHLGYLVVPEAGGPGLIVIHDVWGLSDHTRDMARRLAAHGFVTLAVDLYRELGDVKITDPGPFMRELSDPDLTRVVGDGVAFLAAHPSVAGRKVGVTGFCMGGTYTIFAGASVPGISAIAPFYGVLSHRHGLYHSPEGLDPKKKPREPLAAARDLKCPMLGFYGSRDEFVPLSDIRALETASPHVKIRIYEGAGHAFMNDTRPAAYRPGDAKDAWEHLLAFLRSKLGAE